MYYDDGKYLICGMSDGAVRINHVKADHRDLSDYWLLTMHDNLSGAITDMCLSYDHAYMFTVGADGNIFSYQWTQPVAKPPMPQVQLPQQSVELNVVDITDPQTLSIEQQQQKDNADARAIVANANKDIVYRVIDGYRAEFDALIERNQAIVPSQRIDEDRIVLDQRISDSLQASLAEEARLVRRKLEFDLEKNRLLVKKAKEYFLDPLEDLVTEVSALS